MLLRARLGFLLPALVLLCAGTADAQGQRSKPRVPRTAPQSNFFPPPAPLVGGSDACATPDAIAGTGSFAFDNTSATTGAEGQSEAACNLFGSTAILSDVWFVWTAPTSGIAKVTTVNQTIVDTKIAAYPAPVPSGGCPTAGSALACNDDDVGSGTFQSTITFRCNAGSAYMLQVGLFPGPFPPAVPGTGNIAISINPLTPNDDCTNPTLISGFGAGAPHAFDTTVATTGAQGQNNIACESYATRAIDGDVWFQWTASVLGWVKLTTCSGTSGDTKIAVYQGAGCPTQAALVCDDDGCGTVAGASEARFFAGIGTTYTIQIGTFPGQAGTSGFFTIENFTPPAGDACATPLAIAGPGPHAFDNRLATTGTQGQTEVLCTTPSDPNPRITYDLWYLWTAPGTGTATWSFCNGSTMDSKIAVYATNTCPTSAALACADDGCATIGPAGVLFPVTAGAQYLLQLGAWPGAVPGFGTFTLSVSGASGTAFCFGNGGGTLCPCSPTPVAHSVASNGCANSNFSGGANLRAEGTASVAADTLKIRGTGMPNGSCLYFQGTARQNAGAGLAFGDGLLCAGGTIIRLGIQFNTAGSSSVPAGAGPTLSALGLVPPAGGTRTYQVWYRDAASYCTAATFNLSNGVEISWQP
ncbi:MAG: hypothetical protein JNL28_11730 [Planctomycetes bacterium]|nr:hypothetical protein [Planctomycetota bacterium]